MMCKRSGHSQLKRRRGGRKAGLSHAYTCNYTCTEKYEKRSEEKRLLSTESAYSKKDDAFKVGGRKLKELEDIKKRSQER